MNTNTYYFYGRCPNLVDSLCSNCSIFRMPKENVYDFIRAEVNAPSLKKALSILHSVLNCEYSLEPSYVVIGATGVTSNRLLKTKYLNNAYKM